MTKIVYERLRVDEKKQIKAGTDQLPVSNTGCSSGTLGVTGRPPDNDEPPKTIPSTFLNDCLLSMPPPT